MLRNLREREKGEEAAGFPALDSVGVIAIHVRAGAGAAIMHRADSGGAGLREDGGGEVDFVKRRADARAELHDEAGRIASEFALHFPDGGGGDAEAGAVSAGVQQRDDAAFGIDEKDGAAVGDVDAEADARIGGDEAIGVCDGCNGLGIDDGDFAAVDLICGDEDMVAKSGAGAGRDMEFIETRERDFTFHFHIEPWNAPDEGVADRRDFRKSGKGFDWCGSFQTLMPA